MQDRLCKWPKEIQDAHPEASRRAAEQLGSAGSAWGTAGETTAKHEGQLLIGAPGYDLQSTSVLQVLGVDLAQACTRSFLLLEALASRGPVREL